MRAMLAIVLLFGAVLFALAYHGHRIAVAQALDVLCRSAAQHGPAPAGTLSVLRRAEQSAERCVVWVVVFLGLALAVAFWP